MAVYSDFVMSLLLLGFICESLHIFFTSVSNTKKIILVQYKVTDITNKKMKCTWHII